MELRIIADVLMRPSASCMNTFLLPSTTLRRTAQSNIYSRFEGNRSLGRQFSSSASRRVDWEPTTTSAAPPPNQTNSKPSTSPKEADVSDLVGALGWTTKRRAPPPYESIVQGREERFNKGNTANDLLKLFNQDGPKVAGEYKRRGFEDMGKIDSKFSLDDMRTDIRGAAPENLTALHNFNYSQTTYESPKRALMKLGPSTGRTVEIGGGNISIERGFNLLNTSCAKNQVRGDLFKQRYHERPGMKKKRLASMRWRKKFKEGFLAAIRRTKALTRQGW